VTIWDLLEVARRRWLVTLAGLLVIAGGVFVVVGIQPTYFGRTDVVLLPPDVSHTSSYAYWRSATSTIDFAGVVARAVEGRGAAQTATDEFTLADEGIRHGYRIRQPNQGGQWRYEFKAPVLEVQAVGASKEEAEAYVAMALAQIDEAATRIQDERNVPAAARVRSELSPSRLQITKEGGSAPRAAAGVAVACGLILLATLALLGPRRRSHSAPAPARRRPTAPGSADSSRLAPTP
jgi:hypothetical protein